MRFTFIEYTAIKHNSKNDNFIKLPFDMLYNH